MSHPWWKIAPPKVEAVEPPVASANDTEAFPVGVPWKEEPPRSFGRSRIKCSVPGCKVESGEITTASLGAGLKPYCEHHSTGRDSISRELFWKLPCACGNAADGFARAVGGFLARHTEARCVERTMSSRSDEAKIPPRACACGKNRAGVTSDLNGFFESHAARECTEQTTRIA